MGFKDALEKNRKEATPTKAEKKPPEIETSEEMKEAIDRVAHWKEKLTEAKSELEASEKEVIDYVDPIYDKMARSGEFTKSFTMKGNDYEATYVSSDKFSDIPNDVIEEVKEVLGDDFDSYVKDKTTVVLKPDVLENEALQKELMDAIGEENFGKFFDVTGKWKVVDGFDKKQFKLDEEIRKNLKPYIKKAKPSIKVR